MCTIWLRDFDEEIEDLLKQGCVICRVYTYRGVGLAKGVRYVKSSMRRNVEIAQQQNSIPFGSIVFNNA